MQQHWGKEEFKRNKGYIALCFSKGLKKRLGLGWKGISGIYGFIVSINVGNQQNALFNNAKRNQASTNDGCLKMGRVRDSNLEHILLRFKSWKISTWEVFGDLKISPKVCRLPSPFACELNPHSFAAHEEHIFNLQRSTMQKLSWPEREGKKTRQFIHVCGVKMTRWSPERNQKKEQTHRRRSGKILTKNITYFTIKMYQYSGEQ